MLSADLIEAHRGGMPCDHTGDRSVPLLSVKLVGARKRFYRPCRLEPACGGRTHSPASIITKPVVRESVAQNPRLAKAKLGSEFPDLLLIVVDQITTRFRVHAAKIVYGPNTTADAVARFDDYYIAAAPLELSRSRKTRESGADH